MSKPTTDAPKYQLDPDSFDRLPPRDQALSLLALLAMDAMGLTLDDLSEEIEVEKYRETL